MKLLTPESFAVCFIALVLLAFFMSENRHEENMEKIKEEALRMNKMNFIMLHQFESGNQIAILASSIVGFGEQDDTHACTVYVNNTSIAVRESFDRISNMLKNLAITNIDWADNKSRLNLTLSRNR